VPARVSRSRRRTGRAAYSEIVFPPPSFASSRTETDGTEVEEDGRQRCGEARRSAGRDGRAWAARGRRTDTNEHPAHDCGASSASPMNVADRRPGSRPHGRLRPVSGRHGLGSQQRRAPGAARVPPSRSGVPTSLWSRSSEHGSALKIGVAVALIALILTQTGSVPDLLGAIVGSLMIGLGVSLYDFRRARRRPEVVAQNRARQRAGRPGA
jgi:hypothetical protein